MLGCGLYAADLVRGGLFPPGFEHCLGQKIVHKSEMYHPLVGPTKSDLGCGPELALSDLRPDKVCQLLHAVCDEEIGACIIVI